MPSATDGAAELPGRLTPHQFVGKHRPSLVPASVSCTSYIHSTSNNLSASATPFVPSDAHRNASQTSATSVYPGLGRDLPSGLNGQSPIKGERQANTPVGIEDQQHRSSEDTQADDKAISQQSASPSLSTTSRHTTTTPELSDLYRQQERKLRARPKRSGYSRRRVSVKHDEDARMNYAAASPKSHDLLAISPLTLSAHTWPALGEAIPRRYRESS